MMQLPEVVAIICRHLPERMRWGEGGKPNELMTQFGIIVATTAVIPPTTEDKMAHKNNPILAGSIIHLQNVAPDGGYLDMRGWVTDKPVIDIFYDPHIQALVSTHATPSRWMGSGSWMILPAEDKPKGTPLTMGQPVHLLNMYSGAGYLDTFEWVINLKPFQHYPMTIGVFTANTPTRDNGETGTWTIHAAAGKQIGDILTEGDAIYLQNGFPGAGLLQTYGAVTEHPWFKEYDGQRFFVFTGPLSEPSTAQWIVSSDNFVENLYHVQNQWGDLSAPWHEGGIFKIGNRSRQAVIALNLQSPDDGNTLIGSVTYEGEAPVALVALRLRQNIYSVEVGAGEASNKQLVWDGEWQLGFRSSQSVVAMAVQADEEGLLVGTISYSGEYPVRFRAVRQLEAQADVSKIYYDFFHYQFLKGRTTKLEGVIDTTYRLLGASFKEMSGISLAAALGSIYEVADGDTAVYDKNFHNLLQKLQATRASNPFDDIDYDFQIKQLLNLHTLSTTLNSFFQQILQELMKRSSEKNHLNKMLAPIHQIRDGFRHTATDHEIIQQAAVQRRWNEHADGSYCVSEQAVELLVMDKLTIKAVAPFQHLLPGAPDRLAIITYLSEKTHIRHIPYTDQFLLVGISYDRVPPADTLFDNEPYFGKNFYASELMAIPHEVGHYIYEHGRLKNGQSFAEVAHRFANNPYYRWCEEIFADLYGSIVAGPLSALGLQALLVSIDKERAWQDDDDHPTPVLRVFILADMMRVVEEIVFKETGFRQFAFPQMTNKLDEDWAKVLQQWGYERMEADNGRPQRIYLPDNTAVHIDKVVNIKRVVDTVRPIIVEFALCLIRELSPEHFATIPWVQDDFNITEPYNQEMAKLTGRQFARQASQQKALFNVQPNQPPQALSTDQERLQWYLDNWDDKGPHVTGGHD